MSKDPVYRKYEHGVADLQHDLRLHRELHPAAVARRGRPRQGLAPRQDAGRRLAEVRQPAAALRLHVRPPGEEAPVHGERDRPVARVGPRRQPRLAPAPVARPPGDPPARPRPERALSRASRRSTRSTSTGRATSGSSCTTGRTASIAFLRRAKRPEATPSSWSATSRRWPARTTGSACRRAGFYREILNTDSEIYGGSNVGNHGGVWGIPGEHGGPAVPPLAPRPAPGGGLPQGADGVVMKLPAPVAGRAETVRRRPT